MKMTRVVGIHGIAQQYKGGPQLTTSWRDALRGGLEAADHRREADAFSEKDIRVAYFGDLFRPPGAMAGDDPQYGPSDIDSGDDLALLTAFYEAAINQDPSLGPGEDSMALNAPVGLMLHSLARSKTLAGIVQHLFIRDLKQVNRFLDDNAVKELALERVAAEVADTTVVMIGHSLGSIVAYEYLCRYQPSSIRLLVTIGSPLGIPNIIFERLTPRPNSGRGSWPGSVRDWTNVADPDDIVALVRRLGPLFVGPAGERPTDALVDNGNAAHDGERYLTSREVGAAIGSAL